MYERNKSYIQVRYQCEGPPLMRGQCCCLTCQKISGGAGNLFMAVDGQSFQFTKGTPRRGSKIFALFVAFFTKEHLQKRVNFCQSE